MIEFKALNTLDQLLTYRAKVQPNSRAYTMLDINGAEDSYITYGDMYSQVINIAQRLLSEGLQSRNAILLYPPGIEFIVAFFGCLYAGREFRDPITPTRVFRTYATPENI